MAIIRFCCLLVGIALLRQQGIKGWFHQAGCALFLDRDIAGQRRYDCLLIESNLAGPQIPVVSLHSAYKCAQKTELRNLGNVFGF